MKRLSSSSSWVCGLVGLAVMLAAGAVGEGSPLVQKGQPVGEFVLSPDASRPEVFAATDVRSWIEQMTGAKVPVLSAPSDQKNTKVFVGRSFAEPLFRDDLAKLASNDGFAIRKKDGNVYVFGSRPRATMYGVFSLLERNSDIIWARPNKQFGTVFGKHEDLVFNDADVLDIPVFSLFRGLGGGHPFHIETGEWQLRNRNNHGGRGLNEPDWDMVSTLGANLAGPLGPLFKEHPEYFGYNPMKGGRGGISHGEGTLCLTHPGLPEIWANELVKIIRNHEARTGRPVDVYLLGPGDNWFCCCCPECTKPIQLPDGKTLEMKDPDATKDSLFRSTQIFMFLNEAVKTLKRELPHVKLTALAYIHMAEPPAVEISPDLHIYYAAYPTNTMHFGLLDERQAPLWRERFQKWLKKTPTLGFYEYFYNKPSPLAFYAGENLRALVENGIDPSRAVIYSEFDNDRGARGIGENGLGWDVGAMNTWVIARLFWNPNQDVDQLYRYYIQRTYREAAPQMTEYYELIKQVWVDSGDKTWDGAHAGISYVYDNMIIKKGHEAKVTALLAKAEETAQHPNSKTMIRRMRQQFSSFGRGMNRLMVASIPELAHDGTTFASVQWEKPTALDEFKIVRRVGEVKEPSQRTVLKAGHDGTYLYLRLTASDSDVAKVKAMPRDDAEDFPLGDHAEIWFNGGGTYVFAFDSNGNTYDAKDYNRDWNSNWRVVTQKTSDGWEAIAVIPLEALGLQPGAETKLQWNALREIDHGVGKSEMISYRGPPLYHHFYPIVME